MHPVVYKTLQKATALGWQAFADGWPDLVTFDPTSGKVFFIICERSTPGRKPNRNTDMLARAEEFGIYVRVCIDGDLDVLLTLAQWDELPSNWALPTVYAQRTKLRNIERSLEQLPKDGPLVDKIRHDLQKQINLLRKQLGSDITPAIGSRVIPAGPELDAHLRKIQEEAGMLEVADQALTEMTEAAGSETLKAFGELAEFVEEDVALAELESHRAYDKSKRKKGGEK